MPLLDPHETRPDAATIRVTRAASRGAGGLGRRRLEDEGAAQRPGGAEPALGGSATARRPARTHPPIPARRPARANPPLSLEAARLDLIDEYRLFVHPVAVGGGRHDLASQKALRMQEVLAAVVWALGDREDEAAVDRLDAVYRSYRAERMAAAARALEQR